MPFIPVMQSWISGIITPVFSVTWSFRNHSNMMICCSIIIIIDDKLLIINAACLSVLKYHNAFFQDYLNK